MTEVATRAEVELARISGRPPPKYTVPLVNIIWRLGALGKLAVIAQAVGGNPETLALVLTLVDGVYPDDPTARALFQAVGADPDIVLRPVED